MKINGETAYADPHDSELPLFSGIPAAPPVAEPSQQEVELQRVKMKTSDWIKQFFDAHQLGEQFHAEDLHEFVKAKANIAPASADRIMRDMKQSGEINYEVVNRSQSLYRKLAVGM
jgi:hypothetical protein